MNKRHYSGSMTLACGHGWDGTCDSREDAEKFLALCTATGDTTKCKTCGTDQLITGPLVDL